MATRRAMWKGVVSLGNVKVPVKVYAAVEDIRVHFRLLHDEDSEPLRQEMICAQESKPVPPPEQVKALQVERDQYVLVEPWELKRLEPTADRTIEVRQVVPAGQIDPRYLDRPYHIGPDGDGAACAALRQVLADEDLAAICTWVMRKRAYLGALSASGDVLAMVTLHYADEVLDPPAIEAEPAAAGKAGQLAAREVQVAKFLVNELSGEFDPAQYRNEHQQRLRELIEQKARGVSPELVKPVEHAPTRDDRLLQQLQASVKAARKSKQRLKKAG